VEPGLRPYQRPAGRCSERARPAPLRGTRVPEALRGRRRRGSVEAPKTKPGLRKDSKQYPPIFRNVTQSAGERHAVLRTMSAQCSCRTERYEAALRSSRPHSLQMPVGHSPYTPASWHARHARPAAVTKNEPAVLLQKPSVTNGRPEALRSVTRTPTMRLRRSAQTRKAFVRSEVCPGAWPADEGDEAAAQA
jgi:hypothetical protein